MADNNLYAFNGLSYLILVGIQHSTYYYSHFTTVETETKRFRSLAQSLIARVRPKLAELKMYAYSIIFNKKKNSSTWGKSFG